MSKAPKAPVGQVIHIAREFGGIVGAGGIKDVTRGLCTAAADLGIDTHIFLPFTRSAEDAVDFPLQQGISLEVPLNYSDQQRRETCTIFHGQPQDRLTVHLVQAQRYRFLSEGDRPIERHGIYQYTHAEAQALGRPDLVGQGYIDYFAMNVLLVKAALQTLGTWHQPPGLIHAHDGHAALWAPIARAGHEDWAPALAHVPVVTTIHNAGLGYHQDVGDLDFAQAICGLPWQVVSGCLLDGHFNPLVAAGLYGDIVNTVSENYARELQYSGQDALTGWLGHHLLGRGVELAGITNGIDPRAFDPTAGPASGLAAAFDIAEGQWAGKETCKQSLLENLAAPAGGTVHGAISYQRDSPLFTFIGRLDTQKGVDTMAQAWAELAQTEAEAQLLALGDGSPTLAQQLADLTQQWPGRFCFVQGYDEQLARQIYAGGDFCLVPSRFEPCGLTDFTAQLLGNIPIAHQVGGLVKTVDGQHGLGYLGGAQQLATAMRRGLELYRQPDRTELHRIQQEAVANIHRHFTWEQVLQRKYWPLYQRALAKGRPALPY
ncbi:MAG: glycosyltransferase [Candidatus Latescibacteria bacterium]|nr:glycosyltransferase [Candidatus Latescibacterota bacterium]